MKFIVVIMMLCVAFANATPTITDPLKENKKGSIEDIEAHKEDTLISRNFHSIKKWKMTIEYTNGGVLSKTIEIQEDASYSAMELAFIEAEKYIKSMKKVKDYSVSPVSENSFVLLAGGE